MNKTELIDFSNEFVKNNYREKLPVARLYNAIAPLCADVHRKPEFYGFYPSTSFGSDLHLEMYNLLKHKKRKPVMLDLGCGIGNIMALYELAGFTSKGIEFVPELIEKAIVDKSKITQKNLLSLNSEDLKGVDLLYAYEPIYDELLKRRFLDRLTQFARKGTIFVYHEANFYALDRYSKSIYTYFWGILPGYSKVFIRNGCNPWVKKKLVESKKEQV